jgi:hypothetical protein
VGRVQALVPEPQLYERDIDSGLKHVHCRRVATMSSTT